MPPRSAAGTRDAHLAHDGPPPDTEEVPEWRVVDDVRQYEEEIADWLDEVRDDEEVVDLLPDPPPLFPPSAADPLSAPAPPGSAVPAPQRPAPRSAPPAATAREPGSPGPSRSIDTGRTWLPPGVLVEARVLGPVEVVGWRQAPERQVVTELCCYLALHGGRPVAADALLAAVWPEGRREAGTKSLRTYLSLLRRSLGPDLFPEAEKGAGYQLDPAVATDWSSVETLRADADAFEVGGDGEMAALLLRRALQLVRGTPFAGVPNGTYSWAWAELLVSRIERVVADTALRVARHASGSGEHELAEWALRRGLRAVPFDGALWDALVTAAMDRSTTAYLQAVRDRAAVLGEDAGSRNGPSGAGEVPRRGLNVRGPGLDR